MKKQNSNPSIKERVKDRTSTVEYAGGNVEFLVLGEQSETHNPIAIVPGYTEGLIALHNFGDDLASEGHRQVLISEQPKVNHKVKLDPIDHQAEAWLATLEDSGWTHRPVDVVTHSLGSLVFERAATLAYLRGWTCFDSRQGSKSIFVAPAGTYEDESFGKMVPRYLKLMQSIVAGKEKADSKQAKDGKEILDQGAKSVMKQPRKYLREIAPILEDKVGYARLLGMVGVKPHVIGFNRDQLFPDEIIGPVLDKHLDKLAGYSMVIDKEATHNYLLYHDLTPKAILQIFDNSNNWIQ